MVLKCYSHQMMGNDTSVVWEPELCSYQVSNSLIGKIIFLLIHMVTLTWLIAPIAYAAVCWAYTHTRKHTQISTYAFKQNTSIMFLQCITQKGHLPEKYVALLIQTTKQPLLFWCRPHARDKGPGQIPDIKWTNPLIDFKKTFNLLWKCIMVSETFSNF